MVKPGLGSPQDSNVTSTMGDSAARRDRLDQVPLYGKCPGTQGRRRRRQPMEPVNDSEIPLSTGLTGPLSLPFVSCYPVA